MNKDKLVRYVRTSTVGQDKKKINQSLKLNSKRSTNGMSISNIVKLTGVPKSIIYAELKEQETH